MLICPYIIWTWDIALTFCLTNARLCLNMLQVTLQGVLGEEGLIDASHVEWGIHSNLATKNQHGGQAEQWSKDMICFGQTNDITRIYPTINLHQSIYCN